MVADARFRIVQPLRARPSPPCCTQPSGWRCNQCRWHRPWGYLTELKTAHTEEAARLKLAERSQRAGQVEQLLLENARLRRAAGAAPARAVASVAAQVLYDATDPYSRRVVIDKGQLQGIQPGSPVMDEVGRAGPGHARLPFVSEITLLIDRDQVIPVMNARAGTRNVAYGDPAPHGGTMELRYVGERGREGRSAGHQRR